MISQLAKLTFGSSLVAFFLLTGCASKSNVEKQEEKKQAHGFESSFMAR